MIRYILLAVTIFLVNPLFSQSEITTSVGLSWQKIKFSRTSFWEDGLAHYVDLESYEKSNFSPELKYSRILTDYGLRAGFSVSYMRYRYDIYSGGGFIGRGYTEMRFSQVPIQLHLAYRTPLGAYIGLGPSIRLFSAIELTEWDNGENILEPFLDQGNQLYGIFGFAGYRYKRCDLRLAFERGLKWRLPSTDICSVNNDPCDYNLSLVHSLSLSLGYVWESDKKKKGGKKKRKRKSR